MKKDKIKLFQELYHIIIRTVFIIHGNFSSQDRALTLYEGPMSSSVGNSDAKVCFNSTSDVLYQVGDDDYDDLAVMMILMIMTL